MSLVPMNSAHNIRQPSPEEFDSGLEDHDVIVEHDDGTSEVPEYDSEGNVLSIEHSDGSITVSTVKVCFHHLGILPVES